MCKWTMTAITLALLTVLIAFPARAKTGALLIGTPGSDDALAGLATSLKTGYGVDDIQVAVPGNAHDIAERVRAYLASPGKPDELRVIWILDGGSNAVCPNFDEAPVRPQTRSMVVAPPCIKLLVQAPTTYERLGTETQEDRSAVDQHAPGVAFVSFTGTEPRKPSDILVKVTGSLAQTLACARTDKMSLDFSPSVAAWAVNPTSCPATDQVAVTPPAALPPVSAPEKAPEPEAKKEPAPPPAPPSSQFQFGAPVKGKVISAFGSESGGKPNKGVDIEVAAGTVAKSAEAGEVVFVGELSGYGQVVAVKHENDWATVYARTVHPRVTQGQKVTKGQDLADVDPSANKLHFELRRKGKPMDPEPLIAITG